MTVGVPPELAVRVRMAPRPYGFGLNPGGEGRRSPIYPSRHKFELFRVWFR